MSINAHVVVLRQKEKNYSPTKLLLVVPYPLALREILLANMSYLVMEF